MPTAPLSPEEFIRLVREHQASLRAFVRILGVAREWVDDLAQEALIIAYRRSAEFDRALGFLPWARGIVRNVVLNERRKDARRSRLLHARLADVLSRREDAPEPAPDRGPLVAALHDCMGRLPERSRELLRRRYHDDENAGTLARNLGLSPAAVRQALVRLRGALQGCIESKVGDLRA
jgi:RNA polymerase sigma-70 factor (ECF subfamily)